MARTFLASFFVLVLFAQHAQQQPPSAPPDTVLPNGKSQQDEILKMEHKKNLEDAAAMAKLAADVNEELEKDDRYVLSLKTLKNLDEIERLSKQIRGRIRKF
jgi:hypothetical protein